MNYMKYNQSETIFNTKFKIFKANSNNTLYHTVKWKFLTNQSFHKVNSYNKPTKTGKLSTRFL